MNKNYFSIFLLFISYQFMTAQCTPNAYNGNHGFILPDSTQFPHTQVGIAFHASIQIQVAHDTSGTFPVPGVGPTAGTFTFDSVTIHSVTTNPVLPSGVTLQYTCNPTNCKFLGANTGCIDVNVSAIATVGIYRIYVATVAKGTFTPAALPIPIANQSIAQTVDRYRIVVDPTGTYIGEFDGDMNSFHFLELLPNPSNSNANIKYFSPNTATSKISLTDLQGKTIINQTTQTQKGFNNKAIDLLPIANGVYFLSIESDGRTFTKKLVVQH